MESVKAYMDIVRHYEACLRTHGDTHRGVDWPNSADAETRYRVMLDLLQPRRDGENVTLLDFGCGTSHLLEFMKTNDFGHVRYSGLDISPDFIEAAQRKFPDVDYLCRDMLTDPDIPDYDYIVMNGVFTEKRGMSHADMLSYFKELLKLVFAKAKVGVAFNVMSSHVDWERDDLFHLPLDVLAEYLTGALSRNFVIRNDYGLYEYTTYLFRGSR